MVALLTKEFQAEEDGGIIENIAGEILEGLSNTLLASTKSSAESLSETTKNVTEVNVLYLFYFYATCSKGFSRMMPRQNRYNIEIDVTLKQIVRASR